MNKANNCIYGAGGFADVVLAELEKNGIIIDYFIDQFTKKKFLNGKPIYRLNEIEDKDINIYISITTPNTENSVVNELKSSAFENIYTFLDTLKLYPELIPTCIRKTNTWFSENLSEMVDKEKFSIFRGFLKDDKSRRLLANIVEFRKSLSSEDYIIPEEDTHYFPNDIDLLRNIDKVRFIDGGAFTGDTAVSLVNILKEQRKELEFLACFEPDPDNLTRLREEVGRLKQNNEKTNFIIYPCGLWSSNSILSLSANSDATFLINTDGGSNDNLINVMGVAIDDSVYGVAPNFIKMDVEGAEIEALRGAKNTIGTFSPILAISLYHRPEHLYEIPLLIHDINPNYEMYLRTYGHFGIETVLYCVPKN